VHAVRSNIHVHAVLNTQHAALHAAVTAAKISLEKLTTVAPDRQSASLNTRSALLQQRCSNVLLACVYWSVTLLLKEDGKVQDNVLCNIGNSATAQCALLVPAVVEPTDYSVYNLCYARVAETNSFQKVVRAGDCSRY
jgi:hypothetical protein